MSLGSGELERIGDHASQAEWNLFWEVAPILSSSKELVGPLARFLTGYRSCTYIAKVDMQGAPGQLIHQDVR